MGLHNKKEKIPQRYGKAGSSSGLKVSMLRQLSCTMSYDQEDLELYSKTTHANISQDLNSKSSPLQPISPPSTLAYHSEMHSYHKTLIQALMLSQLAQSEHDTLNSNIKEINLDLDTNNGTSIRSKLVSLRSNILKPLRIF